MTRLTGAVRDLLRKDDGAALVEYGVLIALIAIVAIFFITAVGTKISAKFSELSSKI